MRIRVSAASRLHFGLLHVPVAGITSDENNNPIRKFGGLGLMIDQPGLTVELSPANDWQFEGSLAERAKSFIEKMNVAKTFKIIADGPAEHSGLGVGTSLGMSIAEAVSVFEGRKNLSSSELAYICGRGDRSGIGVHGFRSGGFVVDHGKLDHESLSQCQYIPFPDEWRIIILQPAVAPVWHGHAERSAFARPRSHVEAIRTFQHLESLVPDIVSALNELDFSGFSKQITEFNQIAGEPFQRDQGGIYSSPEIAEIVKWFQSHGIQGVGQSSWGPTVFAVMKSESEAAAITEELKIWNQFKLLEIVRAALPARTELFD